MLHIMSTERGWTHEDMMSMPKHIFFRYYGYWYKDKLNEEHEMKQQERKRQEEENRSRPKQWKSLK